MSALMFLSVACLSSVSYFTAAGSPPSTSNAAIVGFDEVFPLLGGPFGLEGKLVITTSSRSLPLLLF